MNGGLGQVGTGGVKQSKRVKIETRVRLKGGERCREKTGLLPEVR